MNDEDRRLGMNRTISRRDFMEGSLSFAAGTAVASSVLANSSAMAAAPNSKVGMNRVPSSSPYPPDASSLRGSHKGSFETAHELFKTSFCFWLTSKEYEAAINSFQFDRLAVFVLCDCDLATSWV